MKLIIIVYVKIISNGLYLSELFENVTGVRFFESRCI